MEGLGVPLPDGAAVAVDGELILHIVVDDLALVLDAAVIPVHLKLVDVAGRSAGHLRQGDLLGLVRRDGSGGGPGGGAGLIAVELRVVVIGEDITGVGVDLIVVFGVAAVVELHVVYLAAVIPVQLAADEGDLVGGEARVAQGGLPGLFLGDGCGRGLAGSGLAGRGAGAGACRGLRGGSAVIPSGGVGGPAAGVAVDHHTGDGVDIILIALSAGGEVHRVVVHAVAPVQPGGGEGGGGLGNPGGLQGNGLGRVDADILRLAAGGAAAAAGEGQSQQAGRAQGGNCFALHISNPPFLLLVIS